MPRRKARRLEDSDADIPVFGPDGPVAKKKERIEDSYDEIPIFGPYRLGAKKKERIEDSDDDIPLFAPNGPVEKISQQEEEQESQQPFSPEDYLKQEVAGLSQEELNAEAVDEAEARLGIAASMAGTPPKTELEVSCSFHDEEDVARTAAAKMTCFKGKDTLKISK